jgi:hypothetical protein
LEIDMQFDCECGLATTYEDPSECPECGRKMKHMRLEVLEREHTEFFERWHEERRKREKWQQVIVAAVELVCAPAWAGVSDEDVRLEKALRDAGLVTHNVELRGGPAASSPERPA